MKNVVTKTSLQVATSPPPSSTIPPLEKQYQPQAAQTQPNHGGGHVGQAHPGGGNVGLLLILTLKTNIKQTHKQTKRKKQHYHYH